MSFRSDSVDLSLDDTARNIAAFTFTPTAEAVYRRAWLERNIPRAQISTAIYLGLMLVVTLMSALGVASPLPMETQASIFQLRVGVTCPALLVILAMTRFGTLHRFYQAVVSAAVTVLGISVMATSALAAQAGYPLLQMGDVLVVVYACLFLGLMEHAVVVAAGVLVGSFFAIGFLFGMAADELMFAGAVISSTALMATLSARRVEALVRANYVETRLLGERAARDGLSGLYNRRKFDTLTSVLWDQARRDRQSLQIIFVDIDYFKLYNDLHGHQAGDDCIRAVAKIVAEAARRPLDFCARYGGEEFVLVLYGPPGDDPRLIPEQIRAAVMKRALPHRGSSVAKCITVSIGSAISVPSVGRSLAGLIQRADEALYEAKRCGRNRVVHREPSTASTGAFRVLG